MGVNKKINESWYLDIIGPDNDGYKEILKERIELLGLQENVKFSPALDGREKHDLLIESTFLVLPSFTENYGLVVAEALAFGVPCLVSNGTPWHELEKRGCGFVVDHSASGIAEGLKSIFNIDLDSYKHMSINARDFAMSSLTWDYQVKKFTDELGV